MARGTRQMPQAGLGAMAGRAFGAGADLTQAEGVALAVAGLWLILGLILAFFTESPGLTLLWAILPAAMVTLGTGIARSLRLMSAEIAGLRQQLADLQPREARPESPRASAPRAPVPRAPAPRASGPRPEPHSTAPAAVIRPAEEPQPSLALGPGHGVEQPISPFDFILALNFPESDQDHQGFAALRRALKNREARQIIQAAQDLLTLLSQDGIYADDLHPLPPNPGVWRRFARGERGPSIAGMAGIQDREILGIAMTRMREDTIFRDTAHHFLRLFDRTLTEFEPAADEEEIAALAETRTARAFMLLGQVTGVFD